MIEMIGFVTHGLISPIIIFWASTEARQPARYIIFEKTSICILKLNYPNWKFSDFQRYVLMDEVLLSLPKKWHQRSIRF